MPIRANSYWVAALALVAVGIGVRQAIVIKTDPALTQNSKEPAAEVGPSGKPSNAPKLSASNESSSAIVDRSLSDPANLPMEPSSKQKRERVPGRDETLNSVAVIGRPFPISEAIEASCKVLRDYICDDVQEKLSEMSREPRDSQWASQTEALIEHDILFEEQSGRFTIRDIECRTTLCAAEVESNSAVTGYGGYMAGMAIGHDALNAALHTNFNTLASETDASGQRITVTVITFTRR